MIREAAAGGAKIVMTTECFLDGYSVKDKKIPEETYRALGEPVPHGKYFRKLAALADELDLFLLSIQSRTILGDRLYIEQEEAGSGMDSKQVFFFDIPLQDG
jgi:predicted amidohydrolase